MQVLDARGFGGTPDLGGCRSRWRGCSEAGSLGAVAASSEGDVGAEGWGVQWGAGAREGADSGGVRGLQILGVGGGSLGVWIPGGTWGQQVLTVPGVQMLWG